MILEPNSVRCSQCRVPNRIAGIALAVLLFLTQANSDEWSGSVTLYGWLPWLVIGLGKAQSPTWTGGTPSLVPVAGFR